jgi:two-component system, chemotaxis family, chemotaxis protein CheY
MRAWWNWLPASRPVQRAFTFFGLEFDRIGSAPREAFLKHCLVIDDSRVIRKVACRILEQLHFEAEEAEDAASALEACRTRMPDAILLDGQLPHTGGIEFLRSLRRERGGSHPVVLLCTTENDIQRISEAMGAGANEYMMKPFDRASLEDKLTQVGLL